MESHTSWEGFRDHPFAFSDELWRKPEAQKLVSKDNLFGQERLQAGAMATKHRRHKPAEMAASTVQLFFLVG